MKIIPAMDLIEGRCVRLSQGDFEKRTTYDERPLEVAKRFEDAGVEYLHMVDLDGARSGVPQHLAVLEEISSATGLQIDFSGGLRSGEDVEQAFSAGAKVVAVGSAAVKQPDIVKGWLGKYGAERFIIGADVQGRTLAVSGWQEKTAIDISAFIQQWSAENVRGFLCTSIECDGAFSGPDLVLYRDLQEQFPTQNLLASGGVSSVEDLVELQSLQISGVIIGKALYEGRITLSQLQEFLC